MAPMFPQLDSSFFRNRAFAFGRSDASFLQKRRRQTPNVRFRPVADIDQPAQSAAVARAQSDAWLKNVAKVKIAAEKPE